MRAPIASLFAGGTNFAPGGLSIVGEEGPELLNIPRGSQVIPNDVLRRGGGATPSVTQHISIVGPSGDAHIEAMVMQGVRAANQQAGALLAHFSTQVLPQRMADIQQEKF